jgi:hypothetical protein
MFFGGEKEEAVTLFHGTTSSAASKILKGGFRGGSDAAAFFAEEFATALHFGGEAMAARSAQSGSILAFKMSPSTAEELGLGTRSVLGEFRGLRPTDIPGASGYERILLEENLAAFNQALKSGRISIRTFKIRWSGR